MNYQDQILKTIQDITKHPELTKQELHAVIVTLYKDGDLHRQKPKAYISKSVYYELYDLIMDWDRFPSGITLFNKALDKFHEYQREQRRKQMAEYEDDINSIDYPEDIDVEVNPESDMNSVSDILLNNDEVSFIN
jgi:hypothetical protein